MFLSVWSSPYDIRSYQCG